MCVSAPVSVSSLQSRAAKHFWPHRGLCSWQTHIPAISSPQNRAAGKRSRFSRQILRKSRKWQITQPKDDRERSLCKRGSMLGCPVPTSTLPQVQVPQHPRMTDYSVRLEASEACGASCKQITAWYLASWCICEFLDSYIYAYICLYVYVCGYMHTYIYMYIYIHMCADIRTYIHIYTCTYIHVYVYAYIPTYRIHR